jgi:hypothetical protein
MTETRYAGLASRVEVLRVRCAGGENTDEELALQI